MNTKIYFLGGVEKKAGSGSDEVFSIIASTSAIDRQGDSVDQTGWDLKNFNKNPVLLWAHDYSELPIGKVISAQVIKGQLIADFIFATQEANPKAQQIKKLYEEGIVNASSVGFIPLEREGNIITRAELLELSLVPVPANQEALRRAIDKGFDADFIKSIEERMEKGAVAQELNAEETMQAKQDLLEEVFDVVHAFCYVFCAEETPVSDFGSLLSETVDLLQTLADGGEITPAETKLGKAFKSPEAKAFAETKAGATLSKKSQDIIQKALDSMGAGSEHLSNLLIECNKPKEASVEVKVEQPTEAVQETGSVEKATVTLNVDDIMKDVQALLRVNDKTNETVLSVVNRFIASKEKQI